MILFLLAWAGAGFGYILLAGQVGAHELAAAASCGFATALWALAVRKKASGRFAFEAAALGAAARALMAAPVAAGRVSLRLLHATVTGAGGKLRREPFVHGRAGNPTDAARRAVAVLAVSVAPDSYVVRDNAGDGRLAVHDIVAQPSRLNRRWGR